MEKQDSLFLKLYTLCNRLSKINAIYGKAYFMMGKR